MNEPPAPFYQETVRIPRGDAYTRNFVCDAIEGFDWTGTTLSIRIREKPASPLLYDAATDAVVDVADSGEYSVAFVIPAATTETLPARCTLDVRVSKAGSNFGPYTLFRLHLRIEDTYAADEED